MTDGDEVHQINGNEALDRLESVVHSMAPGSLLVEPKLRPNPEL